MGWERRGEEIGSTSGSASILCKVRCDVSKPISINALTLRHPLLPWSPPSSTSLSSLTHFNYLFPSLPRKTCQIVTVIEHHWWAVLSHSHEGDNLSPQSRETTLTYKWGEVWFHGQYWTSYGWTKLIWPWDLVVCIFSWSNQNPPPLFVPQQSQCWKKGPGEFPAPLYRLCPLPGLDFCYLFFHTSNRWIQLTVNFSLLTRQNHGNGITFT